MRTALTAALLLFLPAACATVNQQSAGTRPIDDGWRYEKLTWDNGGDPMHLMFDVFDSSGRTELCAAYAFAKDTRFGIQSYNDLAIANSRITLGGEVLANDMGFMRRVAVPGSGASLGEAPCIVTARPWQTGYGESVQPVFELQKSGNFVIYD